MDQRVPGLDRVGQFGGDVAEDFFPGGAEMHPAGEQIKIEEASGALVRQQAITRRRGRRRTGRGGRDHGKLYGGDITVAVAAQRLKQDAHLAGRSRAGLQGERSWLVQRADEEPVPLRREKLRIAGGHLELEQGDEGRAAQSARPRAPQFPGGGIARRDPAGRLEHEHGTGRTASGGRSARRFAAGRG